MIDIDSYDDDPSGNETTSLVPLGFRIRETFEALGRLILIDEQNYKKVAFFTATSVQLRFLVEAC